MAAAAPVHKPVPPPYPASVTAQQYNVMVQQVVNTITSAPGQIQAGNAITVIAQSVNLAEQMKAVINGPQKLQLATSVLNHAVNLVPNQYMNAANKALLTQYLDGHASDIITGLVAGAGRAKPILTNFASDVKADATKCGGSWNCGKSKAQ